MKPGGQVWICVTLFVKGVSGETCYIKHCLTLFFPSPQMLRDAMRIANNEKVTLRVNSQVVFRRAKNHLEIGKGDSKHIP